MHTTEQRRVWGLKGAINKWKKEPPPADRFWKNVKVGLPHECWPWLKSVNRRSGYGKWKFKGRHTSSHRVAFELKNGGIRKGMHICHTCDNRVCCNPNHLFEGTPKDNMQDALRKGRIVRPRGEKAYAYGNTWSRGEKSWNAKLTQKDVDKIRELCSKGELSQTEIGKLYGVGQDQISRIKNRKRWDC